MSLFPKNLWQQWALDWGLTHYPQKGWLYRNEHVAGERKGLLVRVGWITEQKQAMTACIRFPRGPALDQLRQTLIDDTTLDALPGKGSARRKMVVETGAKKVFRIGEPPEFTLTDTSLVWRRAFKWTTPKVTQVAEWVDALVAAVARATPRFDGRCESCSSGGVRQYVLVDDVPMMMCNTCQQRLRSEGEMAVRTYDMSEARHGAGALLGLAAGGVGAVAWAAIAALTQRIFAAAAIGIGVLIALAYRRGAGRVDLAGRVIAASLTLVSVVAGEILLLAWWVSKAQPDVGFRLDAGWYVYMKSWAENPGDEIGSLFFGLVGAFVAGSALQRPKLAAKIETPGETESAQHRKAA